MKNIYNSRFLSVSVFCLLRIFVSPSFYSYSIDIHFNPNINIYFGFVLFHIFYQISSIQYMFSYCNIAYIEGVPESFGTDKGFAGDGTSDIYMHG